MNTNEQKKVSDTKELAEAQSNETQSIVEDRSTRKTDVQLGKLTEKQLIHARYRMLTSVFLAIAILLGCGTLVFYIVRGDRVQAQSQENINSQVANQNYQEAINQANRASTHTGFNLLDSIKMWFAREDAHKYINQSAEQAVLEHGVTPGRKSKAFVGMTLSEVEKEFKSQGFTNVHLQAQRLTGKKYDKMDDKTVIKVRINGKSFKADEKFLGDQAVVDIYYYVR